MSEAETTGGGLQDEESGSHASIPFQIEADMRKGPPSSAVIRLHGDIGEKQSQLLERITTPLLKAKIDYAVVDMCDVLSISPAPVKALVDFAVQRKKAGVKQICALSSMRPAVVKAIRAAKPPKVFTAYKELRDATKSLKLRGLPDMYIAGTRPAELNMRVMVKVIPRGARVAIVSPYGYIQQPEAELLGKILRRVSLMQAQNVVVDMSGVTYANSHALGSLLSCASAWEKVYGRKGVALTGAKAGIKLALTALGASRVALVRDSVDDALTALETEEEEPAAPVEARPSDRAEEVLDKEEPKAAALDKPEAEQPGAAGADVEKEADTSAWILKNVQAILRSEAKQEKKDKGRDDKRSRKVSKRRKKRGSSEKKKRSQKSRTVKKKTEE
jgi:anti-anti-sigma regulatory factor